jgi:hypothetical protein
LRNCYHHFYPIIKRGVIVSRSQGSVAVLVFMAIALSASCSEMDGGRLEENHSEASAAWDLEFDRLDQLIITAPTAEDSIEGYLRLERAAEEGGRPWTLLGTRLRRAGIYVRHGQLDSAKVLLRGAAGHATAIGHHYNTAVAYDGLATVFERYGLIDSALVALDSAEAAAVRNGQDGLLLTRIQERKAELSGLVY